MTELTPATRSSPREPSIARRHYVLAALMLAAVYTAYLVLVSPQREFPLSDDWAYYQMVQHLLKTGVFQMSQWASTSLVVQTYLAGGLAVLTGGFSFTSARLLTLLTSYIGCVALYDLLLQLSISRRGAMLGALALAVNPLYIYLSYTFMSDVYFVTLLTLSLTCYVRGIKRDASGWLVLGSVLAAAAFLTRQIGLAIPAGVLLALWAKDRRFHWKLLLAAGVIPALVIVGYTLWLRFIHGLTWTLELNIVYGTTSFLREPAALPTIVLRLMFVMIYVGLFALPIIIAQFFSRSMSREQRRQQLRVYGVWLAVLSTLVVILLLTTGQIMPYLSNGINRAGFGPLSLEGHKAQLMPDWIFWLVTFLAPIVGAAQGAWWTDAVLHLRRESKLPSAPILLSSLLMLLLTLTTYWFWDEYLLVFIPLAIYLAARACEISSRGMAIGAVISVGLFIFGVIGVGENLAWNTARWQVGQKLIAEGVPPETINGGFEWVGWYEFETALPQALAQGKWADQFAWASLTPDRYVLAFEAIPGYRVVDTVPYETPLLGHTGDVYVLTKDTP